MRGKKYYIASDRYEQGAMINALNEMRKRLIVEGKYTIKICNAKIKNFKII